MSTKLTIPVVTADQLEIIKRTYAVGATPDELRLYIHDCARQGVHPMDRLIHFTRRTDKHGKSKYTPITSIDFMRTRASDTGEYAGSDEPTFEGSGEKLIARVTVWRFVQGQKCAFTASARWSEYCPSDDNSAFMWRRMPFTMLGKCAEALALRKGFPRQLSGMYSSEEMQQAPQYETPPKRLGRPKKRTPDELTAVLIERAALIASVELCDEALGKINAADLGVDGYEKVKAAIWTRKAELCAEDSQAGDFFEQDMAKDSGGTREPGQEG